MFLAFEIAAHLSRGGYFFLVVTKTMSVANATANVNASYRVIIPPLSSNRKGLTVPEQSVCLV